MPSSTGGGRAWSEEEENYLIETRQHKMPYKHIAAHLQKTELACRLHYHQLSFGTKRRRRGSSSASSARSNPPSLNPESAYISQRPLPALSPPESPGRTRTINSRDSSPNNPVPILPKPVFGPQPMTMHSNALRLITQDVERMDESTRIDKERLLQIYDAHRGPFWCMLAAEYGDNVDPMVLEDAWRKLSATQIGFLPPTPPNRSPHTPNSRPMTTLEAPLPSIFAPVNMPKIGPVLPPRNTFAISSLLTDNKDIRNLRPLMV
ncbi:MAG: hypothetical protein GOMPHAMPRED_000358 [Gomphillus americanus]|uniref:Myb-like domain-containing protein n=1 Tax=Gomphillus americanus TaxID=1940652 RepID=A0A8H3EB05_9LECA|nr:MAG: hypothetical protein GOMPHAMPRED_000358 [Gomphillus americanus]